ncbi:MAG: amidohydrolase [Gemmatimonadetes bacterium]|uniref:Amidohydrolase n=1 Tax=Candidatus Kutchimonas denitrificans TaxID=3056748 RepID=A0AAE4Z6M8_9BACT|nr:amidohydrolase [Gemmatimonadota bacterium]NIR74724.1 amidohydrolase [Candidatus Kutchimonas denitrificans]NIS01474.1 amidohydrolase [Gemmatimonadota bacterium]NIT67215.1 amidohydrolase [Gemmatimonadota bacterium]NIU52389.1 amidohydrolase family protein [Gemmatimonadota bacterium]
MRNSMVLMTIAGATLVAAAALSSSQAETADLILTDGRVYTLEPDRPRAEAVAVRAGRILAIGDGEAIASHEGPGTVVVDLDGAFVLPGLIDNHTHFGRAGQLLLGINLLDVADSVTLGQRVAAARDRLPEGAWILGGDWGAYEEWAMGSTGGGGAEVDARARRFTPHRDMVDPYTPSTPVLLNRWDRSAYLANSVALELAGITRDTPDPAGGTIERDPRTGEPTGILTGSAVELVQRVIPPKSFEQRVAEARVALRRLAENGVTGIHDITGAQQMRVFEHLRDRGELTVRVYARPTLDEWDELATVGIRHGFGDEYLKIGGLKGFVDGIMGNSSARFREPYDHRPDERGRWRAMVLEPPGMAELIRAADSVGLTPQVHAIGDLAVDTLLDWFELAIERNGPGDHRFRMIHAQVVEPNDFERFGELGIIAEVQPYHAIDDMRWMEERIGHERSRGAYAFRSLLEGGAVLSFGSDWPGTNASWYPAKPLLGIYAAVTRQTLDGMPEGGWFPEERIDVETAIRAYTMANAFAAREEGIKGSIGVGKLADFTVLDRDITAIPAAEIKDVRVLGTIVGGQATHTDPAVAGLDRVLHSAASGG